MISIVRLTLCLFLLLGMKGGNLAANDAVAPQSIEQQVGEPVTVKLLSETDAVQPGHSFWTLIHFKIEDHWHAYWKNPGSAGMPPTIDWSLPQGFKVEQLVWPAPKRLASDAAVSFGYEKELLLLAQISAPASYLGKEAEIRADLRWVVCSDSNCLPGDAQLSLHLPIKQQAPAVNSAAAELFSRARTQAPKQEITITAERKAGLIQLNFNAPPETAELTGADFFSEQQHAINDAHRVLLERSSSSPEKYTLILQENQENRALKGILVLQTSHGASQAYDLDLPIAGTQPIERSEVVQIEKPQPQPREQALVAEESADALEEGGFALALLFAFIGGLILNLMPCVLPVISFKILGFVKLAGEERRLIFKHGAAFSIGVILSFWVLAILLLLLQSYGHAIGWGFQLQEPLFVGILASFLFLFGLSLFGLFEIGTSLISAGSQTQQAAHERSALMGSFLSGVLATVVATPCTGPFLGTAVGFAFTLPPLQTLLIFTSIGLGMAAPYLLLSAFPYLVRFLPKAGGWMVAFKEAMGFVMMASVLWLIWVFSAQTNMIAVNLLLAALLLLAAAGWVYGRWCTPVKRKRVRSFGFVSALACLIVAIYTVTLASSPAFQTLGTASTAGESIAAAEWEPYSPQRVAELHQKGVPVFVDFTAKWCLICQVNHLVLSGNKLTDQFKKLGVVKMKADWTKKDGIITEALRQFGRNSVPLYVLYPPDAEAQPHILPQVLTHDIVMKELKQIDTSTR